LAHATPAQFDRWGRRMFAATAIEEVFGKK
jgi:hypothetical protein